MWTVLIVKVETNAADINRSLPENCLLYQAKTCQRTSQQIIQCNNLVLILCACNIGAWKMCNVKIFKAFMCCCVQ